MRAQDAAGMARRALRLPLGSSSINYIGSTRNPATQSLHHGGPIPKIALQLNVLAIRARPFLQRGAPKRAGGCKGVGEPKRKRRERR